MNLCPQDDSQNSVPDGLPEALAEAEAKDARLLELTEEIRSLRAKLAVRDLALKMTDEELDRARQVIIELAEILKREQAHDASTAE